VKESEEALLFLKKKKQKDFFYLGLGHWRVLRLRARFGNILASLAA